MKSIVFRPIRRVKKTGKIVVASYTEWRKLATADYNEFNLTVADDYKLMPKDEFVHNHKGELLYFFPYHPANVMAFQRTILDEEDFDYDQARVVYKDFIVHHDGGRYGYPWTSYFMRGTDCDGVPCFSHHTADSVAERYGGFYSMNDFEPLTVNMVRQWLGWFLYKLQKSYLKIGK